MRRLFRAAASVAAATVVSGTLVAGLAGTAQATTVPPWEVAQPPATTPAVAPDEVGGLTFYNSSGQVITGGNISDNPIAAYVQGNTSLQSSPTLADLNGFTPVINVNPGAWNEVQFSSSALPNTGPRRQRRSPTRACPCTRARAATACRASRRRTPTRTRRAMAMPASTCCGFRPTTIPTRRPPTTRLTSP